MSRLTYDIVVIGGGHAGAEAAWAAANLGARTALVTMDQTRIGQMSCNPAIGGLAKGQMVREIDALGGLMGLAIDATGIQFRILNASKGPAVRGPRAQADKYAYAREVQRLLATRPALDIIEGTVESLHVEGGRCAGVTVKRPDSQLLDLPARAVVLTTGTFMRGLMHTGERKTAGGRVGEGSAEGISGALRSLGFELGRLKTGTPPRLDARTIDFDALPRQPGDDPPTPFSDLTDQPLAAECDDTLPTVRRFPLIEQRICWITHTDQASHDLIRANLHRAPMYNGQIETTGPRYCPSIEDKVVRFADRASHHVFLEPESLETHEIYCNGISTSLPADVQEGIVRRLPGCERATILRYGYAVEYDMVWPHQIDATCMTKRVSGLFLAGQINGTSGYEEAAGQGLIAGLNAVRYARGEDLVRLGRDQAYIGVMMDDLVTKTPREPYRMFTSRAEHRLVLRSDNAAERLTPMGRELGLVDDVRWRVFERRQADIASLRAYLRSQFHEGASLLDWLRRPEVDEAWVASRLASSVVCATGRLSTSARGRDESPAGKPPMAHDRRILTALISEVTYAGFIDRHRREFDRVRRLDTMPLPTDCDYTGVTGLRNEARQTLNRFRPATLGQAGRLAGITPADLTVLAIAFDGAKVTS